MNNKSWEKINQVKEWRNRKRRSNYLTCRLNHKGPKGKTDLNQKLMKT